MLRSCSSAPARPLTATPTPSSQSRISLTGRLWRLDARPSPFEVKVGTTSADVGSRMRRPVTLLAAIVTGMTLIAAGLVGSHFGFHDWPMAPTPQSHHVTVEHDTLAAVPVAVVPAEEAAVAHPASGPSTHGSTKTPATRHTARKPQPATPRSGGSAPSGHTNGNATTHTDAGDGASDGGATDGRGSSNTQTSTSHETPTPTPATPEVTPASSDP